MDGYADLTFARDQLLPAGTRLQVSFNRLRITTPDGRVVVDAQPFLVPDPLLGGSEPEHSTPCSPP
jgi:hypothetical protein